MVQKSLVPHSSARRGRPRAYDPEQALDQAMATFWDAGYAATSLDELSAATGMNRPSLYGAFGDKHSLYLATLERYRAAAREDVRRALLAEVPLRQSLRRFYDKALSLYLSGEKGARGCFMIGTAATESVADPEIRTFLLDALREIEQALEARIRATVATGELPKDADTAALGKIAASVLYSLAIQARAGLSKAGLEAIVTAALDLICGPAKAPRSGSKGK